MSEVFLKRTSLSFHRPIESGQHGDVELEIRSTYNFYIIHVARSTKTRDEIFQEEKAAWLIPMNTFG